MIEMLVVLAFAWGGYEYGKAEAPACPQQSPLVVSECPEIQPPTDDTFGATTRAYSSLVTQYRKCKTACQPTPAE